jgi:hypothetical protein
MKNSFKWALALALSTLGAQAMACFTVYNPAGVIVYSGNDTPIDMSYQIHERLPAVFPGGHMVFDSDTSCQSIDMRRVSPQFSNGYVTTAMRNGTRRAPRADRQ